MCQFKSAIVVKDERAKGGFRLLLSPWTESHSDLITIHGLNDSAKAKLYFARIEFSPPSIETAHQVETYKLKLDEVRKPEWWTKEIEEDVTSKMQDYIKRIIVSGKAALLIGGQFIIAPTANIGTVKTCVINACFGAKICSVSDAASIDSVFGSASIDSVSGSATIGSVFGAATINFVFGSASIDSVSGSASIDSVSGSATICSVSDAASIKFVSGSASINFVSGSASIGSVSDAATIGSVSGSATIGSVFDAASIVTDKRSKK